jgi:hypothetical protein
VSPFVTIKILNFSDTTAHILSSHSAKLVVIIRHTDIFASNISTLPRKVFTHESVRETTEVEPNGHSAHECGDRGMAAHYGFGKGDVCNRIEVFEPLTSSCSLSEVKPLLLAICCVHLS